jgi:hypothetical protein
LLRGISFGEIIFLCGIYQLLNYMMMNYKSRFVKLFTTQTSVILNPFALVASMALACFVFCCAACNKNKDINYAEAATCTSTPTYTADIAQILNASCATQGCHNAASKKDGIDLSSYAEAKNEFLKSNTALASVHHASGVKAMPQGQSKLSDASINKLDCWVKNGCPE